MQRLRAFPASKGWDEAEALTTPGRQALPWSALVAPAGDGGFFVAWNGAVRVEDPLWISRFVPR